jgi:hypothetical protein
MREPGHIGRVPAPNNVSTLVLFLFFFLANIFGIDLFIHGAYLRYNNNNNNNIYNSVAFYLHSAGPLLRCPATTTSGDIIPKPVPPEPMTFNAFMTAARDCTGRTYTAAVVVRWGTPSPALRNHRLRRRGRGDEVAGGRGRDHTVTITGSAHGRRSTSARLHISVR